jgi:hypothetical protein
MSSGKGDAEKARYWQRTIREAVRRGMSIREFCRQHRLKESQFYWWQHKLRAGRQERRRWSPSVRGNQASFALVSDEAGPVTGAFSLISPGTKNPGHVKWRIPRLPHQKLGYRGAA